MEDGNVVSFRGTSHKVVTNSNFDAMIAPSLDLVYIQETTLRRKTLVTLKNRKAGLDFSRKCLKMPDPFWNTVLWTDETKINCTKIVPE